MLRPGPTAYRSTERGSSRWHSRPPVHLNQTALIQVEFWNEMDEVGSRLRHAVSKNRFRFQDGILDLDLSYITPQIIAMGRSLAFVPNWQSEGFPGTGAKSLTHNPVSDLESFFTKYHQNWKIVNVCNSDYTEAVSKKHPVFKVPTVPCFWKSPGWTTSWLNFLIFGLSLNFLTRTVLSTLLGRPTMPQLWNTLYL